jgi:hypothetical protein
VRDVLADLAVAPRGAGLQDAIAVDERDREAVDLRLGDVLELGILDALAREVVSAETGSPPTRCVGESGVSSSGCSTSMARSSSRSLSYWSSVMLGSSST